MGTTNRPLPSIDQYEAYYKLEDSMTVADHDENLPSMRALFEAMHDAGLVFAPGDQVATIERMDQEDAL